MTSGSLEPPVPAGDPAAAASPAAVLSPTDGTGAVLASLVGERTVPHLWAENYWFRRHEAAYLHLAAAVVGAVGAAGRDTSVVVEAGSGEGYGVHLLDRAGAGRVVSLDYDRAALVHAGQAYPDVVGGRAVRSNLDRLPLASGRVDVVTSFQVIEHLWSPEEFLAECARVLRPGGLLVLTTPNRLTFSPGLDRRQKPANPFHFREFDADELLALVARHLHPVELQAVSHAPRLLEWEQRHGSLTAAQLATPPEYWPAAVADLVRSVTAADFVVTPVGAEVGSAVAGSLESEVLDLAVLARSGPPRA